MSAMGSFAAGPLVGWNTLTAVAALGSATTPIEAAIDDKSTPHCPACPDPKSANENCNNDQPSSHDASSSLAGNVGNES